MSDLPHGTVTLLFSDVEGSTRHLLRLGERYPAVLARHRELLTAAIQSQRGVLVDTQGDGSFAAFPTAHGAIMAAVAAQHALAAEPWPDDEPVLIRIGIHTGEPMLSGDSYTGLDVHRAARVCTAAHGGQVLLSEATRDLALDAVPDTIGFLDLGRHVLKDLPDPERLIQIVGPGLPADFPAPRAVGALMSFLGNRQPLIGRERELQASRELILRDHVNLVSLTGPGGTGKTTLAIHLAASLMSVFPEGVHFVPLAALTDPHLVPGAVARALGVQEMMGRPIADVLRDAIGTRSLLLILDNFEHLFPAVPFVADLVESCPRLKVVVTSRELLRLSREYELPIPPLELPPLRTETVDQIARNDAVRLFLARAESARPGFRLTGETAPVVSEICRRLDGLPLALELAAARVRMLTPQALLTRLDRRLPLLIDGPRDRPARQRTLRDTIGWSYGLLDGNEQYVFRTLGVFVGGCTLESAEAVCQPPDTTVDVLNALGSLVDKNLVRQEVVDGEPRFSLLETIREFAQEQLEASATGPDVRRRHASYYLAFAETADPLLIGPDQVTWLDRLEQDYGNLIAALGWSRDTRASGETIQEGVSAAMGGLRLAGALHWFWQLRGHVSEGRHWLTEVLTWDVGEGSRPERARALHPAGVLAWIQGDYIAARDLLNRCAAVAEHVSDPITLGRCLTYRAVVEAYLYEEGLIEDKLADRTIEQSLDALKGTTDAWGLAHAQSTYGTILRNNGEHLRAAQVIRDAIALAQTTGDRYLLATCLPKLANTLAELGDFASAEALFLQELDDLTGFHDDWLPARCMQFLAGLASRRGDQRRAALLLGAADATMESVMAHRVPREARTYERVTATARGALGDAAFNEAYRRGRAISIDSLRHLLQEAPSGAFTH